MSSHDQAGPDVFDVLAAVADAPTSAARMLPLAVYRDEAVLERELATIFGEGWLCVGRTADVAEPGSYTTAEIPWVDGRPRPLVVVRGHDHAVRVFDNVCVHRGAELVEAGPGTTQRFTCPYHAWTYRLDGSFVGAPHLDGADASACALVELRSEIWEGFVFVEQGGESPSLGPGLVGLHDVVRRFDLAGYVPVLDRVDEWATNWKLLVENFMDAYHVFKVHADTFGASGDSTGDTTVYPGTDHWAHHRVVETGGPPLVPDHDRRLDGAWRQTIVLAAVFPGLVFQLQPDWMWHLRITPLGTDRVRIAWQVAVAPSVLAVAREGAGGVERYVDDLIGLIDRVNAEDRPIVEGVRRAVHRPSFAAGPLSPLEGNVVDFDRYVARRLTT